MFYVFYLISLSFFAVRSMIFFFLIAVILTLAVHVAFQMVLQIFRCETYYSSCMESSF